MHNGLKSIPSGVNGFLFPPEWTKAALVLVLVGVWLMIGLFAYLNHHTKKPCFRFWAVAWMFYSVYLAAFIGIGETSVITVPMMARYTCIGISALFMFWGSFQLTGQHRNLREVGLAVFLILVWSYVAAHLVEGGIWTTVMPFALQAAACAYTGIVYVRHSGHRRGASVVRTGFALWGGCVLALPLLDAAPSLMAIVHLASASLALMIIIGMVIDQEQAVAKEIYGALLESSNDAVFLIDCRTLTVLEANLTALQLTGLERSELVGHGFSDACPQLAQRCSALPETGGVFGATRQPCCEFELTSPDSTRVVCESTTSVVHRPDGPLLQVSVRDVSERKQLEAQLVHAQKMEAVGRLAGGVAHDFNNILTVIIGHTELLSRRMTENGQPLESVQEIEVAAIRAASLTEQLLAFSRKQMLEPKVFDLNELVAKTEKMFRRLIGEDVTLEIRLDPHCGRVKTDPGQIEQVIMNLVVNARDAMPQGGQLTIETANVTLSQDDAHQRMDVVPGEYVILAVRDTGTGLSDKVKMRLFEPFFTTKPTGKGTGLGLAVCHGIVKQSGGHISVSSELGRGTTFKVYLPVSREQIKVVEKRKPVVQPAQGTKTLLFVEDEPAVRELGCLVLRELGYKVLEAADGEEAFQLVQAERNQPIDLLITDVVMPQMGGRELADRLRLTRADLKVLFCSGFTQEVVNHPAILKDNAGFLQKPYTPATLAQCVQEVIGCSNN